MIEEKTDVEEVVNIIITGVGGQGTVSAGHILSEACIREGIPFTAAETHGMSQRGGSVVFHLRIGRNHIPSIIGKGDADIILAGEAIEALRTIEYLKPRGHVISSDTKMISPVASQLGQKYPALGKIREEIEKWPAELHIVPSKKIAQQVGNTRVENIILLGRLLSMEQFPIDIATVDAIIQERWPKVLHDNLEALYLGYTMDQENPLPV